MWYAIHFLRALASLMVTLHHVPQYLGGRVSYPILPFENGAAGVDIFFIISGFVMHQSTSHKAVKPARFVHDRLSRIVPMYWLGTTLLAGAAILLPLQFQTFKSSPAELLQSLAFLPIFDTKGMLRPVLHQGWTLQYEMAFYLFTSVILVFHKYQAALWAAVCLALASLLALASGEDMHASPLQLLGPIVIEFLFGAILSFLIAPMAPVRKDPMSPKRWKLMPHWSVSLLMLVMALVLLSTPLVATINPWRPALWGVGAWLVSCVCLAHEPLFARLMIRQRWLSVIADSSYVLYLFHGMVFSIVGKMLKPCIAANQAIATLTLISAAIGTSVLIHVLLESKINRFLKEHRPAWMD